MHLTVNNKNIVIPMGKYNADSVTNNSITITINSPINGPYQEEQRGYQYDTIIITTKEDGSKKEDRRMINQKETLIQEEEGSMIKEKGTIIYI